MTVEVCAYKAKMEVYAALYIYSLLLVLVDHAGSAAITTQCPSGSLYRDGLGLRDFPPELRDVNCSRLSFNHNLFKTSENGRCITCDFLSFDYNIYEELTAVMLSGYPGAKHLSFKYNPITRIDGEALKDRKRVDLDFNPFHDFPWSYTVKGQQFSMEGVLLKCTCEMKDAVERGVVILKKNTCIGHSDSYDAVLRKLPCPATELNRTTTEMTDQPTTDPATERISENRMTAPCQTCGALCWFFAVQAMVFWIVIIIISMVIFWNRRKIGDWISERKIGDWIRERIRSMPWPGRRVDHGGGQKLPPPVPSAPTDEDDVESALLSNGGTSAR